MKDAQFPSGPWIGFYVYRLSIDRHRMDLNLTFSKGRMDGEGTDDVGKFVITGRYDAKTKECWWTKGYIGRHDVDYRGFREGKGIWGTWEITWRLRGGFHIWPLSEDAGEAETESEEQGDLVECQTDLTLVGGEDSLNSPRKKGCDLSRSRWTLRNTLRGY